MKIKISAAIGIILALLLAPSAHAITADVSSGGETDMGSMNVLTEFGMVTGSVTFILGNFSWVPDEIWLIPEDTEPDIFSKGLTQDSIIEIPENVTSSTCRTAVYYNNASGYGFKIYNTASTAQILGNGTFCGLAYNGTYFMFAKY